MQRKKKNTAEDNTQPVTVSVLKAIVQGSASLLKQDLRGEIKQSESRIKADVKENLQDEIGKEERLLETVFRSLIRFEIGKQNAQFRELYLGVKSLMIGQSEIKEQVKIQGAALQSQIDDVNITLKIHDEKIEKLEQGKK